jgi:opacity protein-like surface antigen
MPVRKFFITAALFLTISAATPSKASAEWWFTPFIGVNFGGSADFDDPDFGDLDAEFEKRLTYGATLSWVGSGAVGFEFDFGYSPNFFETVTIDDDEIDFSGDSNVTTLMANVVFAARSGGIRPYASGGVGIIRTHVGSPEDFFDDVDTNDLGFNAGGGVAGFFSDRVGLRGDIRYFRSLQDDEPDEEFDLGIGAFKFWRATVGVIFSF